MKATELIGKVAIRTRPTNTIKDHSYTDHPIKVITATNHCITFEYADWWHRKYMDTRHHHLDSDFCDDNWIEYNGICDSYDIAKCREQSQKEEYLRRSIRGY